MQKKEHSELYKEMELFEQNGIHIFLEETSVSAFGIVQAHMVKEEGAYMRDYILDEKGHLKEIRFNNIR